jgi:hypothetical protein
MRRQIKPLQLDVSRYCPSEDHQYGVTGLSFYKRQMKRMRLAQGEKHGTQVLQELPAHSSIASGTRRPSA